MPVTTKTMQAIRQDQRGIDNRRARAGRGRGNNMSLSAEEYDRIFGRTPGESQAGTYVMRDGHLVSTEEAGPVRPAVSDAKNMVSTASGCTRAQVDDFNKTFGHMGVTYRPDGKAVYADTQSRKRVLRARGLFDRDGNESPQNF